LTAKGIAGVVIRANPVLAWEQYSLSLDRMDIKNPKPKLSDVGGFESFSFSLADHVVTRSLADDLLTNGGMREILAYNVKGTIVWEGAIYKVTENTGTTHSELNVNDVFNRQWTRYNTGGTPPIDRSTVFEDLVSQARVGIRDQSRIVGDVDPGVADQGIQALMAYTSFPSPVVRRINFGGKVLDRPQLTITAFGYWRTLAARAYNQTASSGNADLSVIAEAIVDAVGEFVVNKEIQSNTTQIEQETDVDRLSWEILETLVSFGDGGFNKWVTGFSADKTFYFKQAERATR
jgi:hypothetical protein